MYLEVSEATALAGTSAAPAVGCLCGVGWLAGWLVMVKRRVDNFFSVTIPYNTTKFWRGLHFLCNGYSHLESLLSYSSNNNNGELLFHYKGEEEQGPDQFK